MINQMINQLKTQLQNLIFGTKMVPKIGIDVSSSAVKILELGENSNGYFVKAYGSEPIPMTPGFAGHEKQNHEPTQIGECIATAFKESGSGTKSVALAIEDAAVITKMINMSAMLTENELEEQIKVESEQYIPYPIEEVNFDFQVMGPGKEPNMVDIILVASRKEHIDQKVAAVEVAGLTPHTVDVENYALESACHLLTHQMPNEGVDKIVAIVEIGSFKTTLLILENMEKIYLRETPFGGKQLTEEIMRNYGMSFEEANTAKNNNSLTDEYIQKIVPNFLLDLAQQIDRLLQFFYSSSTHGHIDQVIISGGSASIPNIAETIQKELSIPTVIADPFAKIPLSNNVKQAKFKKEQTSLMIALGLALRSFEEEKK